MTKDYFEVLGEAYREMSRVLKDIRDKRRKNKESLDFYFNKENKK